MSEIPIGVTTNASSCGVHIHSTNRHKTRDRISTCSIDAKTAPVHSRWTRPKVFFERPSIPTSLPFHPSIESMGEHKYRVDNRPSDYEYALMSAHVYQGNHLKSNDSLPEFSNWKIHSTQEGKSGYFSAIYMNDNTEQIVLAYRGTDSLEAVFEDIRGILFNQLSPQKEQAFNAVKGAVTFLKEKNGLGKSYHLSFTGHSLGAFLAELSVFYAHADFQLIDVNAVTFESPGSRDSLETMQLKQKPIDFETLDIISYLSYPNQINTLNSHVGALYHIYPNLEKVETTLIHFLIRTQYTIKSHAIQGILDAFKEANGHIPLALCMTDWPLFREKSRCFDYLKKAGGRYVLKEQYATDPNFDLSYRCRYRYEPSLNNLNSLALRHFSSNIQKFLKDFDRERRKISFEKVKQTCKKLNLSKELTESLINYRKENDTIVLREGNIRDFRTNLSRYLVDHPDKIPELLQVPLSPVKHLTKRWNLSSRNQYFIHRNQLREIEKAFSKKEAHVVVCYGLGGMGKTQLALEFVWKNHKKYRGAAWLNAESVDRLFSEYDRLGQDLNLYCKQKMDRRERGLEVKRYLEDPCHEGWLLVYDNVQAYGGPEGIIPLIPSAGGKVLITSRLLDESYISIPVGQFCRSESIEFIEKVLEKPLSDGDEESVNRLAELFEDFPLGLAQAGAYIKRNQIQVARYLEIYKMRKKDLLKDKTHAQSPLVSSTDHERAVVYVTWDITIETIGLESPLAENWLRVCSCLESDNIPDFLFKTFAEKDSNNANKEVYEKARGILSHYLMLTIDEKNGNGSIHPLLQEVIRMKGEELEVQEPITFIAAELLQECFPKGDQLEDYTKMRQLLPHFEGLFPQLEAISDHRPMLFLAHLLKQKEIYAILGDPHKQKELLERALPILEQYYGKDHVEIAIALISLQGAYFALGEPYKAKKLIEQALALLEGHYSKDHVEVARARVNLGIIYHALREPHQAKGLIEQALILLKRHYGENHFEVTKTRVNLGLVYHALGKLHQAKGLIEQALTIQQSHYGEDHVEVAKTHFNLGIVYMDLGKLRQAKESFERALLIEEKHYGRNHFEVAKTLETLENVYAISGDSHKQNELLERALTILEGHYSKDHMEVARILLKLGMTSIDLREPHRAQDYLERALTIQENHVHVARDHVELADALAILEISYGDLKELDKVKDCIDKPSTIQENDSLSDHFEVANALADLGKSYSTSVTLHKHKEIIERALILLEKELYRDYMEMAMILTNLATTYDDLGKSHQRKKLFKQASLLLEKHYNKDPIQMARILLRLGIAYDNLGQFHKAEKLFDQVLIVAKKPYVKDFS